MSKLRKARIIDAGPDGIIGTADDIVSLDSEIGIDDVSNAVGSVATANGTRSAIGKGTSSAIESSDADGANGTAVQTAANAAASRSEVSALSVSASAADVDLTASGNFGSIDGAVFIAQSMQASGAGVFPAFVQIDNDGTEQGYNTDARPQQFDEKNSLSHNHSLLLANVTIVEGDGSNGTVEGLLYREFLLDANEANGGDHFLLSLDSLEIYQETSGALTNYNPGSGFDVPGEHLVYDLDAGEDRWIALNAGLSSGSGQSDIRVLIPNSLFDPNIPFVYLYSSFGVQGDGWSASGGSEEWGIQGGRGGPGGGTVAALNINKAVSSITSTDEVVGTTAVDAAGDVVNYTMTLANTGNVSLTGVTVTDPLVAGLTRGADIVGNNDTILNAGEIWSFTAQHTVTQAEIDSNGNNDGSLVNTATADSDQTGPDTSTASVALDRRPELEITKTPDVISVDSAGDVINYEVALENTGNTTLTNPTAQDLTLVAVAGAPIEDPNVQVFIPINDGDFNLGDTNQNNARDPGETFQFVYPGDFNMDGFHDPGETWTAFNLGDTNQNGIHEGSETWVGDTNQNGIEEEGERWQFQNLGDANQDGLQNNGETWQYANTGDIDLNGVEDPGETFLYRNAGDTNQNGVEDSGETFQFYNAGDTNQNGVEDNGETFQFATVETPLPGVDVNNDTFNDGDANLDGELDLGETWQFTASHTVTQDEIDNRDENGIPTYDPLLAHDNTASGGSDQTDPVTASASVAIAQNPHVTLVKNAAVVDGVVDQPGDVIRYRITVTNDGNMTLTNPVVSDPSVSDLAGVDVNNDTFNDGDTNLDGELDLGEMWKYTASYMATQDDIDNRVNGVPTVDPELSRDNTATVVTDQSGQGAEGATSSDDAAIPIAQDPHVTLVKNAAVVGGVVDQAGDVIRYRITVTNDGNMTLTNPVVSDPSVSDLAGVDVNNDTFNDGDTNLDGELDIGEMWKYTASYTATQDDIDNGGVVEPGLTHDNTATATTDQAAADADAADSDSRSVTIVQNPSVMLAKLATVPGGTADSAGEVISYAITVNNNGNMTLSGLAVTDPSVDDLAAVESGGFNAGDVDQDGRLDLSETWQYAASYTVTQDDIDNGGVVDPGLTHDNTATATTDQAAADADAADSDSRSVTIVQNPSVMLAKLATVPGGTADSAGEVISYAITVNNNGNMTLTNVQVSDPSVDDLAAVESGGFNAGDADQDGKLDLGETWQYTATYTVTQDDLDAGGTIDNTATATTDQGASDDDFQSVTVVQNPAITLDKSGIFNDEDDDGLADPGETISYTLAVSNTGNVTLSDVTVTDPAVTVNGGPITLAPGALDGGTFTGTYAITQADIDAGNFVNTASVSGEDAQGDPASDSDDATVTLAQDPNIALVKTGQLIDSDSDGANAGDLIEYIFTATNDGNVTLSNLVLNDTVLGGPVAGPEHGDINANDLFDVGETWLYRAVYILDQDDIDFGGVSNDATATADDPFAQVVTSNTAHWDQLFA